jgi:tRNA 2-thiouridine synthesizing protein B
MLYLVNKSPLMHANLEAALRIAPKGAPFLLYEDGVYAAAKGARSEALVQKALADHPLYALDADLEARSVTNVIAGILVIDYDGFVELVEQHDVAPWI